MRKTLRSAMDGARRIASLVATLIAVVIVYAVACASPGDEGSQSNFVKCTNHSDCDVLGAQYACIANRCKIASRNDAGAPSDASAGSCKPSSCPPSTLGAPCCVGPDGPCGINAGLGCRVYRGTGTGGGGGLGAGGGPPVVTGPGGTGAGGDPSANAAAGGAPSADAVCVSKESPIDPGSVSPDAGNCAIPLPAPPVGQTLDFGKVTVAEPDRPSGEFYPIPHLPSDDPSACAEAGLGNGWYYSPSNPIGEITLCPGSCGLAGSAISGLSLVYGCSTPNRPAPTSDAGSSISCAPGSHDLTVALSLDGGTCSIPLFPSAGPQIGAAKFSIPWPQPVSLSMLPHLSGDDSSGCGAVLDGWYYDNPNQPHEVLFCDQTCNALRANLGSSGLAVLRGCDPWTVTP